MIRLMGRERDQARRKPGLCRRDSGLAADLERRYI
jgi:hypothetical protein